MEVWDKIMINLTRLYLWSKLEVQLKITWVVTADHGISFVLFEEEKMVKVDDKICNN